MREQKEQEKQNELLRVVAEQNHERLIEYDVKEDRAVVYAIENDRFEVLFDIEDYVKKNHYGSVFIDPEDKKGTLKVRTLSVATDKDHWFEFTY